MKFAASALCSLHTLPRQSIAGLRSVAQRLEIDSAAGTLRLVCADSKWMTLKTENGTSVNHNAMYAEP